jgi:hypothetical protein
MTADSPWPLRRWSVPLADNPLPTDGQSDKHDPKWNSTPTDQITDQQEHATNWMNFGSRGQYVSTRRMVRRSRTEYPELENARSTPPIHLWISQTATWIETRFGGDVECP